MHEIEAEILAVVFGEDGIGLNAERVEDQSGLKIISKAFR
jgi:hypothetical protein